MPVTPAAPPLPAPARQGADEGYVDLLGRRFYRIGHYDRLDPFFMTIVGSGDTWLFVSSTGGLTAGRVDPDSALFPYYTDDKIAESAGRTGGLTVLRAHRAGLPATLWEPFAPGPADASLVERALYKDPLGTTLVFEEVHTGLQLRLRVTWQASNRFGIVRSTELANLDGQSTQVEVVDGFVNVLPAGIGMLAQNRLSNLLDAYKRTEVDPGSGLGMFWLSSRLTDLAEPSECLVANTAWQVGLTQVTHLASSRQLDRFRAGLGITPESDIRGARGCYLVHSGMTLDPGGARTWRIVGDVDMDAARVIEIQDLLSRPEQVAAELEGDLAATRAELERILATSDGLQVTGDERATAHHLANTLFNVMRGGIPAQGYSIDPADFRAFIHERSRATEQRCEAVLAGLPADLDVSRVREVARDSGDPDLVRLTLEYLPLTFSRRHGDPSRPWNRFRIVLRDDNGRPRLNYEGNWRDIFQNWESLGWSFPEYFESMVAIFVNATTADGYNPYRISRSGIDWEIPEPENPFSNIGYWSDHQIVYLLRLLEASAAVHPGRLRALLRESVFTHADVPYRIAPLAATMRDPFNTIAFDESHAASVDARVAQQGADGRLVHAADGDLLRVTLAEKLLVLVLAKLVNFVPDGGIWMNTQRPEWNDANNALVGRGLSVVTLAQLRRFVTFMRGLIQDDVQVTGELAHLADAVTEALTRHLPSLHSGFTAATRRDLMVELGTAGSDYRRDVYSGFRGQWEVLAHDRVTTLLDLAQAYIDQTLRSNARPDALHHSYNILDLRDSGAEVRRLTEMLEGQVAMLASGELDARATLALLSELRSSRLYRPDQHSYLLYPDKHLSGFQERNVFPAGRAADCPLVAELVERHDRSLVVQDVRGDLHFAGPIRNARDVEAALDRMAADPSLTAAVQSSRGKLLAIFEDVFNHAEFTGRSGTFFAYEGLGSIYWHMVSKLLLAVQEQVEQASAEGQSPQVVAQLAAWYEDVRAGLGYCKSAAAYGAFPTDPYSHTPAGSGAKQPGMTGQVKEEVLTRLGEFGLRVTGGQIRIRPTLLRASEWLRTPETFEYLDARNETRRVDLPAGSLAFTFVQVPVVYQRSDVLRVQVVLVDGTVQECPGGLIPADLSAGIFGRTGAVERIEVRTPAAL